MSASLQPAAQTRERSIGDEAKMQLSDVVVRLDRQCSSGSRALPREITLLRIQMEEHARRINDLQAQIAARSRQSPTDILMVGRSPASRGGSKASPIAAATSPAHAMAVAQEAKLMPIWVGSATSRGASASRAGPRLSSIRPSKAPERDADGDDPFGDMWSMARLENLRAFDQNLLTTIYNKPNKEVKHQAALVGSGFVGLLSMPFGPIGVVAGGMFGAVCGGVVGLCADRRRLKKKLEESELEKKRLKSLVRWASERLSQDDEVFTLIEVVTLEFKPMADIAEGSKNARKQLRLLDTWVAQKYVNRQLMAYMDDLLSRWQDLSRKDFIRAMFVFQTLSTMYSHTHRALDEQELQFVVHLNRLLEHASVKSVIAQAQQFPRQGQSRIMECMVFADHARQPPSNRKSSKGEEARTPPKVPSDAGIDLEAGSEDSDDDSPCNASSPAPLVTQKDEPSAPPKRMLKKPFFKNWDDFMEFDAGFKRRMPITLSEFELLYEKEREPNTNWDVCVDRKEIRVAKVMAGAGCITLRAWATVPGVLKDVAFYLFHQHEERVKWDKVFADMHVVGEPQNGSEVLYSAMRIPGVTPRDFLQYRRVRLVEDGSIAIVLRSAEHPDCPENKNFIRAESYIGGYVLRQEFDAGEPVLKLFLMTCSDVKGLVPKWIINMVAPRKPAEWVESLRRACVGYQEANPNCREIVKKYMEQFDADNPWDYELMPSEFDGEDLGASDNEGKLAL